MSIGGDVAAGADHAAEIARKQAEIARLEREIAAHRKALGQALRALALRAGRLSRRCRRVAGVRFAAAVAGVRYRTGRTDVMLAQLAPGSVDGGRASRARRRARRPVLWCEERLRALGRGAAAEGLAIVVNAGNANAFTGGSRREAVERVTAACGEALGIPAGNVFMASTGVIGEPLPAERITAKLAELRDRLSPDALEDAARAIMTTDTFAKGAGATVELDGATVAIAGFAKGSGMIAPDMATMLAFVFTDAAIAQPLLQRTRGRADRRDLQRDDGRRRHLDLGHAAGRRDGRHRAWRRSRTRTTRATRPSAPRWAA